MKFVLGKEYSANGIYAGIVDVKLLSSRTQIPNSVLLSWDKSHDYYDNKLKDFRFIYVDGEDIVAQFKTFELVIRPPKKRASSK